MLMKTWFMPPNRGTIYTKTGTANESNILSALPLYLDRLGCTVHSIIDYGLLCSKEHPFAAFSPDGIAVCSRNKHDFIALVEVKTKCTPETEATEEEIAATYGKNCFFSFVTYPKSTQGKHFRNLIPELAHRTQILHGMATGKLRNAFYVVASTVRIIRIVWIQSSEPLLNNYLLGLQRLKNVTGLDWIDTDHIPIPNFAKESFTIDLKHAVDQSTVERTYNFWLALNQMVMLRGKPLPPGRLIIPTVISMWNRCKGPIDVYSRYLHNVSAQHGKMNVVGTIWLRMIMTCVYNAYHCSALYKIRNELANGSITSYRGLQNKKKYELGSFSIFCSNLSDSLHIPTEEDVIQISRNTLVQRVTYKKREEFRTGTLMTKRLNGSAKHVSALIVQYRPGQKNLSQHNCVLCCRYNHRDGATKNKQCLKQDGTCSRRGFRTRYFCSECKVALCIKPRYNGKSCYDLFHSEKKLINPCCWPPEYEEFHVQRQNKPTKSTTKVNSDCNYSNNDGFSDDDIDGDADADSIDSTNEIDNEYNVLYISPSPKFSKRGIMQLELSVMVGERAKKRRTEVKTKLQTKLQERLDAEEMKTRKERKNRRNTL